MDPASLVPAPGMLQVPWGWFEFLLLLTFGLHILFMNIVVGSVALSLVAEFRGRDEVLVHDLATKTPTALAFTVNAGVAPLLFLQVLYGHFFYISAVLQGWWFLSIIGLVIVAYYGLYLYDFRFERLDDRRMPVLFISALLLLVVSFIFSNLSTFMLTPERWKAYFDFSNGMFLNVSEPTLFPRWLHFMAASVAVGGLFQSVLWRRREAKGVEGAKARADQGMRWFAWATVVQTGLGVIFLLTLRKDVMLQFMGGSGLATALLIVGLALPGVLISLGFARKTWPAVWTLLVTLVVMVLLRDLVRIGYMRDLPGGRMADLPTQIQYSPMIMFFVALALGLGAVAWMLAIASRAKTGGEG